MRNDPDVICGRFSLESWLCGISKAIWAHLAHLNNIQLNCEKSILKYFTDFRIKAHIVKNWKIQIIFPVPNLQTRCLSTMKPPYKSN